MIDILRADPKGLLVLVHGLDPFVGQRLVNRILEQASDLEERIVMLGAMSADQFRALMGVADIVLDPFHYSGGHTTLEAIDARAPLITWPGRFMRGRHTAGFLSLMGLDPMVSTSQSDYVTRALALGRDPALRQEMRAAYQTQDGAIFECAEALDPLADAFESAIVDAARRY